MKELSIDIETYSSLSLKESGVYKYVESDDFEILLFGYSVDGGEVRVVDLLLGEKVPEYIIEAILDENVIKWAFNAQFERICLSRYLSSIGYKVNDSIEKSNYLNPSSWRCTMIWSATLGLPMSLEGVGAVLGLEKQKLLEGKNLIKYFCVPCKPTKVNGGRTRNLPRHDMEKWGVFKSYNKRDVETELGIKEKISRFPVSDEIWDEYHIDQEINDRGIGLDMEFVKNALFFDEISRNELIDRMRDLTQLENPNSVLQMKEWLLSNGVETESLDKKAVATLLKSVPTKIEEVLSLRQKIAKSSVKKYTAMESVVCRDGRARGMFQFYGANRTGRFSGRLIQLQNLPQNHISDLAAARGLIKVDNYEAFAMLYDDIPGTLSQLIRTSFVPQDGNKFIVSGV